MKLLLDTHILLWWVDDNERLGDRRRAAILRPDSEVWFSIASLWEIVVKTRTGKLNGNVTEIEAALYEDRFNLLAVSPGNLATLVDLPKHHGDSFDQLLIAQAISENAIFVSEDHMARKYPVKIL